MLGVLAPPGDITTADAEPSPRDDKVWLPFVTCDVHTVYPAPPETDRDSEAIGDPFSLSTRIYKIPEVPWQMLGTYLLGKGHQAFIFSIPGLAVHQRTAPTLKSFFEPFGFDFGKGGQLIYNAETEELIASLNAFNMTRLESLLGSFQQDHNSSSNINLQIEVFQLPSRLCIELGKSAGKGVDHTPEWKAVQRLVDSNDAQLVTLLVGNGFSGQRCKVTNGDERIFVTDYLKKKDKDYLTPDFDEMRMGTSIEFDSQNVDAAGSTIALHFVINHQTGPPGKVDRSVHFPSTGETASFEAAVYRSHQTNTQFEMRSGTSRIVGMWRAEAGKNNFMQIAFVRVQSLKFFHIKRIH